MQMKCDDGCLQLAQMLGWAVRKEHIAYYNDIYSTSALLPHVGVVGVLRPSVPPVQYM